jgi:hypothetical protein
VKDIKITEDKSIISDFIEFIAYQGNNILSKGSLREYHSVLKSFIEFQKLFPKMSYEKINQAFFDQYENFLMKKKNPSYPERGLLNDTICKYVGTLRVFLKWGLIHK